MEISTNPYDDYLSLKAGLEELIAQRARIEMKEKNSISESNLLESDLEQSRKQFAAYEKKFIREEITDKELSTSKTELERLSHELAKSIRMQKLAAEALPEVDREMEVIKSKTSIVLRKICSDIKTSVEKKLEPDKTREKLLEAYAAIIVCGDGDRDWRRFLQGLFPAPQTDEVKKIAADFRVNHKL